MWICARMFHIHITKLCQSPFQVSVYMYKYHLSGHEEMCVYFFPQVHVREVMVTDSIHLSAPFTVKRRLRVKKLFGQLLFIANHSCC